MSQIFENNQATTYSYMAGGAIITWGSGGGSSSSVVPLMMSDIQIQYQRTIQPVFPVNVTPSGTNTRINVISRPQGSLSCTGILAPFASSIPGFLESTGKACITPGNGVSLAVRPFSMCAGDDVITFNLTDVILMSATVAIQGGDQAMVNMPLQFMFTDLKIS